MQNNSSKPLSPKQQLLEADRRLMSDIIRRSRAWYAAQPTTVKRAIVRQLEDERQIALAAEKG